MPKIIAIEPHANRQSRFGRPFIYSNLQTNLLLRSVPPQAERIHNLRTGVDLRTLSVKIFRFAVNGGTAALDVLRCVLHPKRAYGRGANSGNP